MGAGCGEICIPAPPLIVVQENFPHGGRFQKTFSYTYAGKTPFDLLKKALRTGNRKQTNQNEKE